MHGGANCEQLIGNNQRWRINTSGSQRAKITAYDGTGIALDSFIVVFTVTAAAKPSFNIRIPGLEIAAVQFGGIISGPGEALTAEEILMAKEIFGTSLRYESIRVIESSVVAAPTTLGNAIRSPKRNISNAVMIHELARIWQFKTWALLTSASLPVPRASLPYLPARATMLMNTSQAGAFRITILSSKRISLRTFIKSRPCARTHGLLE